MPYPKAPIQEAIFDVRVDRLAIANTEELSSFHEEVKADFPTQKKRHNLTSSIKFTAEASPLTDAKADLIGYVFINADETRQIQTRIDGFTYNVVKTYEHWDKHFAEFLKLWTLYDSLFNPTIVLRIATRYINRINLPVPFTSFQDFITNIPPVPKSLPQTFNNFFMQTQTPCSDNLRHAIITETLDQPGDRVLPFILDIDVFQEQNIQKTETSFNENFSAIRKIKNDIFESCITEKARELFT
jgi:uncharacterized protein (TIGR04255 family)